MAGVLKIAIFEGSGFLGRKEKDGDSPLIRLDVSLWKRRVTCKYVTMFHPLSRCRPSRWAGDSLQLGAENAGSSSETKKGNFDIEDLKHSINVSICKYVYIIFIYIHIFVYISYQTVVHSIKMFRSLDSSTSTPGHCLLTQTEALNLENFLAPRLAATWKCLK